MKIAWILVMLAACAGTTEPAAKGKRVEISVTEKGFEPRDVAVAKGEPVTLVFTRKTERTCAKEVILQTGAGKIEKELPLDQPVEIAVTFPQAGALSYACAMNMIKGVVTVN
jgi:plastocyanin domain-containing protein